MSAQHRQTTNYQRACSSFSPTEPYQRGNNNVSPRLAGIEAHPWWDGTRTAASCSRRGRREQPRPLQPARRAGSFSLSGKTRELGEPSQRNPWPDPAAASPARAPVPWPATGGRDVICLPLKCGGECRKLGAAFAPPAALEQIRGSVSFGGQRLWLESFGFFSVLRYCSV